MVTGYSSYQFSLARIAGGIAVGVHALAQPLAVAVPLGLAALVLATGWQRRIVGGLCTALLLLAIVWRASAAGDNATIALTDLAVLVLALILMIPSPGEALRLESGFVRDPVLGWRMAPLAVVVAFFAAAAISGLPGFMRFANPDGPLVLIPADASNLPGLALVSGAGASAVALIVPKLILVFLVVNLTGLLRPAPIQRIDGEVIRPTVFFDGVCARCSSSVDFIIREDYRQVFRYAPIQGETAGQLLSAEQREALNSIIFRDSRGREHNRSDAILRIGMELGGLWKLGALGLLVPRVLRNRLYDLVARHRYEWFGKKESCRLPTPQERELFLM